MLNWQADGSTVHRQEYKWLLSALWTHEHILRQFSYLQDVYSYTFSCTLGTDTSIRVSHELTESSVETPLTVIEEPYTIVDPTVTTMYVSTTRLHNQHTGDYPITITETVPIDSADEPDIRVFLKEPKGLAEGIWKTQRMGRGKATLLVWGDSS